MSHTEARLAPVRRPLQVEQPEAVTTDVDFAH